MTSSPHVLEHNEFGRISKIKAKKSVAALLLGRWLVHLFLHEWILSSPTAVLLVLEPADQVPEW